MADSNLMAEKRIKQYQSHLQHIDELMKQADVSLSGNKSPADYQVEITKIKQERDKLADYVDRLKQKSPEQLLQTAGPMVMWEIIAQRLEKLVGHIGKGE